MTKRRAFAIHLTASVTIFLIFLGIMFFVWYPAPYFEIDGGWRVLRILAGVDVVLGPLLTLIVFEPGSYRRNDYNAPGFHRSPTSIKRRSTSLAFNQKPV